MNRVYIIGAGLAGLSAAYHLRDHSVQLFEASGQAGGRCRSFFSEKLGCEIDNGNHILIEANGEALALIETLGCAKHWQREKSYLYSGGAPMAKLKLLYLSAFNTPPWQASHTLALHTAWQALIGGHKAIRPLAPLQQALISPLLNASGADINYHEPVKKLEIEEGRVIALQLRKHAIKIAKGDTVICAAPPTVAAQLIPNLTTPDTFAPIINGHFRYQPPEGSPPMLGLPGGGAVDWIFANGNIISTTTSAAKHDEMLTAEVIWSEVCMALGINAALPPHHIISEKRATFTPSRPQQAMRPPVRTAYANLILAGDYVQNDLPASIEGAIRSGKQAALAITCPRATC